MASAQLQSTLSTETGVPTERFEKQRHSLLTAAAISHHQHLPGRKSGRLRVLSPQGTCLWLLHS